MKINSNYIEIYVFINKYICIYDMYVISYVIKNILNKKYIK